MRELNVLGIEAAIGSMLIGAKKAGFNVIGNFDTRNQFYTGTFEKNFDRFMVKTIPDLHSNLKPFLGKIDYIVSQPKCSSFSSLSWANTSGKKDMADSQSTFPIVRELIDAIKPNFFLIDNLPKALLGSSLVWWRSGLSDQYTLNVEFISNYHYGNTQLKRDRIFIMGYKKELEFQFKPGEERHNITTKDVIGDLLDNSHESILNHDLYPEDYRAPNMNPFTIAEAREFFENHPEGINPSYIYDEDDEIMYLKNEELFMYRDEDVKKRIGTKKLRWNKHSQTVTGSVNLYHPVRNDPLTCRERARLMGYPDNFEFIFRNDKEKWGIRMGQQTGQAVPIQFPLYFAKQIMAHLNGEKFICSEDRFLTNELVEENKQEYCKKYGYHERDCEYCVLKFDCKIK